MASQSGVSVSDEIVAEYNEIKGGKKHKYMIMKISDDLKSIELEKTMDKDDTLINDTDKQCWDTLMDELIQGPPRYVIYDMCSERKDETSVRKIKKLVFISWCSDGAKIKPKMLHASSKDTLLGKLDEAIARKVQATDRGDLDYDYNFSQLS